MDPTRANEISHNTIIEKLIYEATSHLMAPIFPLGMHLTRFPGALVVRFFIISLNVS